MLPSMPPKYSVAQVVGFIKGESGHPHGPDVHGTTQELYEAPLLGSGGRCLDGWEG